MIEEVASFDDPRVAPYRNLKDRELAREGGRFIAEGEPVVRRLLASDHAVQSVLLARRRVQRVAADVPPGVPVYVVPDPLIHEILGYKFHSGVMACGMRKAPALIEQVVPTDGPATLIVCPETNNTENLGSMIRVAAGFGATGVLLGERCCDPYYRQSIRVSMGTVFSVPIVQSRDLDKDLLWLREQARVELMAAVADPSAVPLAQAQRPARLALLFGNEAQGLSEQWLDLCGRRVTIPMQLGTDSLNVHVAAAVFLYRFIQER